MEEKAIDDKSELAANGIRQGCYFSILKFLTIIGEMVIGRG
jgi:hypothetical protein